jgi:hypothetical protein
MFQAGKAARYRFDTSGLFVFHIRCGAPFSNIGLLDRM